MLQKSQNILPRPALLNICKAFVRTHLDYVDVILGEAYNEKVQQKYI